MGERSQSPRETGPRAQVSFEKGRDTSYSEKWQLIWVNLYRFSKRRIGGRSKGIEEIQA